jgi:hypothetical protein
MSYDDRLKVINVKIKELDFEGNIFKSFIMHDFHYNLRIKTQCMVMSRL